MTLQLQYPEPTKDEIHTALQDIKTTSTIIRTVRVQKNRRIKSKFIIDRFWGRSRDTWCIEPDKLKEEYRNRVIARDSEKCNNCGLIEVTLSIDHKLPISRGGPVNDVGNMQLLCVECHEEKTRTEYIENGLSRRLRRKH